MKLFLLKDKPVKFYSVAENQDLYIPESGYRGWAAQSSVDFPVPCEQTNYHVHFCSKLKSKLESWITNEKNWRNVAVTMHLPNKKQFSAPTSGNISISGHVFSYLGSIFPKDYAIFIQVSIKDFFGGDIPEKAFPSQTVTTGKMKLTECSNAAKNYCFVYDSNIYLPSEVFKFVEDNRFSENARGLLTITMIFEKSPLTDEAEMPPLGKLILNDPDTRDAVILAKGGIPVPCHRSFLYAKSLALKAAFKESYANKNVIKMDSVSEESVRALLAYIYYDDITAAIGNVDIAMDLLEASGKYLIPDLKKLVSFIFYMKDDTWLSLETATRLFQFLQNFEGDNKLKEKAALIMIKESVKLIDTGHHRNTFGEMLKPTQALLRLYIDTL